MWSWLKRIVCSKDCKGYCEDKPTNHKAQIYKTTPAGLKRLAGDEWVDAKFSQVRAGDIIS